MAKEKKSNRSSIIKIIISNYNDKGIKEVKVRYNKQAQLDTFLVESEIEDKKFILKSVTWKAKEKYRYDVKIEELGNNSVEIAKEDKFLNEEDKTIRKYRIDFMLSPKNENVVVAEIKDLLPVKKIQEGLRTNTRSEESKTERKLLSKGTQLTYSKIAKCSPEDIDSIKIYKIKRYLSYRSNMLLFFSLVNDFLCEGLINKNNEKISEIWRIFNDKNKDILEDLKEKITSNLEKNLSEEIKYYKNRIEKNIERSTNSIESYEKKLAKETKELESLDENNQNNYRIRKLNSEIFNLKEKIKNCYKELKFYSKEKENIKFLKNEDLKSDVEKILKIYVDLRHKLAHYEYKYFEELFENDNSKTELAELLDLKLFRYLTLSRRLKIENKTNYIKDNTSITIMGKTVSAKKCYSLYNTLCEQKNGFNNFINRFFVEDGVENIEFKKLVNEKLEKDIEFLEKEKSKLGEKFEKNEELSFLKEQKEELNGAYIWDIHNLKNYKAQYSKRKEAVKKFNELLVGSRDKTALRNQGEKLVEIKEKMEAFTKRNSLIRLKYKLQIAYAFLMVEFKGNVSKFKNSFDMAKIKIEDIKRFQSKGKEYLDYSNKNFDIERMEIYIEKLETSSQNDWLSKDPKNNLFKFYVLIYILLPFEFKGDFLGFVKKHYYDIKNIEFLDENNDKLSDEQLEKMKDDSFFNKIRLFEKNTKKYDIFSRSILKEDRIREYFEKLGIQAKYYVYTGSSGEQRGIFNKNIIIPIFKYYQIVLKLYNDVEIAILLYLSRLKNMDIEKVMELAIAGENYNFTNLLRLFQVSIIDKNNFDLTFTKDIKKIWNKYKNSFNSDLYQNLKEEKNKDLNGTYIRNSISHLNYEQFIEDLINDNLDINLEMHKLLNYIEFYSDKLNSVNLDFNFINDYYMKKEQFIFGQLKQIDMVKTNCTDEENDKKAKELLEICKIPVVDNIEFKDIESINKLYEKYQILRDIAKNENIKNITDIDEEQINLIDIKKDKNIEKLKEEIGKKASDILGLYKKQVIKLLKEKLVEKIRNNEEKIIYITIYEVESKKKEVLPIKIERVGSSNEFIFSKENKNVTNYDEKEIIIELGKNKNTKLNFIIGTSKNEKIKLNEFELKLLIFDQEVKREESSDREKYKIDLRKHYSFNLEVKYKDLI